MSSTDSYDGANPNDIPEVQLDEPHIHIRSHHPMQPEQPKQNPITWLMEPPFTQPKIIILVSILTGAIIATSLLFWLGIRHQQAQSSPTVIITGPTPTDVPTPTDIQTYATNPTDVPTPTDIATPMLTPTLTPRPTTSPTPTTTPFTALSVTASVSPVSSNDCNPTFSFNGTITVNAAGTVQYTWDRSDNTVSNTYSLTFSNSGTQNVATITWDRHANESGNMKLHVHYPNDIVSDAAAFSDNCITPTSTDTPTQTPTP